VVRGTTRSPQHRQALEALERNREHRTRFSLWCALRYEDGSTVAKSLVPPTASMPTEFRIVGFPWAGELDQGPEPNIAISRPTKRKAAATEKAVKSPKERAYDAFKAAAQRHFVRFFELTAQDVQTLSQIHIPPDLVDSLSDDVNKWSDNFHRMWFRQMTHNLKEFLAIFVARYPNGQLLRLTPQERVAAITSTFAESGACKTGLFHRLHTAVDIQKIITGQGPVTDLYREYYIALLSRMISERRMEIQSGTLPTGPKKFSKAFYDLQGTFARDPQWWDVTMDMFPFCSKNSETSELDEMDQTDETVEPAAKKRKRRTVTSSLQVLVQAPVTDSVFGSDTAIATMESDAIQENNVGSNENRAATKGKAAAQTQAFFPAPSLVPSAHPVQGSTMAMDARRDHEYLSTTYARGPHTQGLSAAGSGFHESNPMIGPEPSQMLHERAYPLRFEGRSHGNVVAGLGQALPGSAVYGPSSIFADNHQAPLYCPPFDSHGFRCPALPVPAQAQGHAAFYGPNAMFMDHSQVTHEHQYSPPFEEHQVMFGDGDGSDGYFFQSPDNSMDVAGFDNSMYSSR
jgi:hypothetical protein